jgi:hypothetical protein
VCEDLGRVTDLSKTLRLHGTSHLLAPVFAKPTLEHYWEHSAAKVYAGATGTTVFVVDSLVVGRLSKPQGKLGFCLTHGPPGTLLAEAEGAADVACFVVDHDSGITRCAPVPRGA